MGLTDEVVLSIPNEGGSLEVMSLIFPIVKRLLLIVDVMVSC